MGRIHMFTQLFSELSPCRGPPLCTHLKMCVAERIVPSEMGRSHPRQRPDRLDNGNEPAMHLLRVTIKTINRREMIEPVQIVIRRVIARGEVKHSATLQGVSAQSSILDEIILHHSELFLFSSFLSDRELLS